MGLLSSNKAVNSMFSNLDRTVIDKLTGLLNMSGFMRFAQAVINSENSDKYAFVYFDLNNFKTFNKEYGFKAGDVFLTEVAVDLSDVFGDTSIISRLNDDHFMVICNGADVVDRISKVHELTHSHERDLKIELKAGICYPEHNTHDSVSSIMDQARIACSTIKNKYDVNYCVYDTKISEAIKLREYVINNFDTALKKGYIKVYYQAVKRTMTGLYCSCEALARWIDPNYGFISPGVFVPILEDLHLIPKLDMHVLELVCKHLEHCSNKELAILPISINLSRVDFQLGNIFDEFNAIVDQYHISHSLIHVEITESAFYDNSASIDEQLTLFRNAGYEIWMDDFGSGYSSLNFLNNYVFDTIKLDMGFMRDFSNKPNTKIILSSIIRMAKEIGIQTLAEGVETTEQFEFLKEAGCDRIQGYLFGKPEEFDEGWIRIMMDKGLIESHADAAYMNSVGHVNVQGAAPTKDVIEPDLISITPVAVMEYDDGTPRYLYTNQAYRDYLKSIGLNSLEASLDRGGPDTRPEKVFLNIVYKCTNSMKEESFDYVVNGNACSCKARCISRDDANNRFAIIVTAANLSNYEILGHSINSHTALRHLVSIYNRIDMFDEFGNADNIYISAAQDRIADDEKNSGNAIAEYARKYILPKERDEFIQFYDIKTAAKRASYANKDHVTAFFHSSNDEGQTTLQMYVLIPIVLNGRRAVISCVRDIDNYDKTISTKIS